MQEEMVDIVNEQEEILYSLTKKEAHVKGLLHKTVIGEIRTSKGEFVLILPSSHKQDAGQYVSAIGGHVTSGESNDEAILREAEEETGLKNITPVYIDKAIFNREVIGRKENHYFYLYEIVSDKELILGNEGVSIRTFSKEELKKLLKAQPTLFGDAFHFVIKTFYPELIVNR